MCDTFGAVCGPRTWFAKNSDRPVAEAQVAEVFGRRPAGGALSTQYRSLEDRGAVAVLGCRPTWLWGFEMGINEHGVAIGNERVYTTGDAEALAPASLIGMDLVRLGLERATSADAAVEVMAALLERYGQGGIADASSGEGYYSSFLIADRTSAWVVETVGATWAARPTRTGPVAISNRLHLTDDWSRGSPDLEPGASFQQFRAPDVPTGFADVRYSATTETARQPDLGAADLAAATRHHGRRAWGRPTPPTSPAAPGPTGPAERLDDTDPVPGPQADFDGTGVSVCMHIRGFQATAASLLAELPRDPEAPLRAWVALGSPCASVFVPVFPPPADPAAMPAILADPTTWDRMVRLRDRAEQAHDDGDDEALAAVRSVFGPLERELWEEADAIAAAWGGDDDPAAVAYAASVGDRLEQAWARLGV